MTTAPFTVSRHDAGHHRAQQIEEQISFLAYYEG